MGIYYIACVLLSVFNFLVKNPFAHELKKKKKRKRLGRKKEAQTGGLFSRKALPLSRQTPTCFLVISSL
jgi:hypothetical protein